MKRTAVFTTVTAIALSLGLAAAASTDAHAQFAGQIITSKKRIPTSASSKRAYNAKLRKIRTTKFWEDTKKKEWKIHFAAFFKRPLNDLEVTIKLYDVTNKQRRMLTSFQQYLDRRGEKTVISYLKLDREKFGVNRKILMVMEDHRRRTLAKGTFQILGEAEKYSGKVEFTEEETRGK